MINHRGRNVPIGHDHASGEIVFIYAKIAKFIPVTTVFAHQDVDKVLDELRQLFGSPEVLLNMETLVKRIPNIDEKVA